MSIKKLGLYKFLSFALILSLAACTGKGNNEGQPAGSAETVNTPSVVEVVEERNAADAIDYSKRENWVYFEKDGDKSADIFFIAPTAVLDEIGSMNMNISNKEARQSFTFAVDMERGIYDKHGNMFAPFYRQAVFNAYKADGGKTDSETFQKAFYDVDDAFKYYLSISGDRPLVLAGFSQGADMAIRLLKKHGQEDAVISKLAACYAIGWRITPEDLRECPWLKPALEENDSGVIVSFNSEAPSVKDSMLVPAGTKTFSINPLNWRIDSEPAPASMNKGACLVDANGKVYKEIPNLTGAYIDMERGTLKCPDVNPADYVFRLFPDGVYHTYDYQFFYMNLQENVGVRLEAFTAP
ncbi:MAG: DUF3089 domain-containing protein [bacterium]|nr:DUF3089 domain-containing protein [bacterium]